MEAVESHMSILGMQNSQIGRKEWRAISDAASREIISSIDNSEDQHTMRPNGSVRMGTNHVFRAENNASSHGLRFHSSGSNASSSETSEHRLSQEAHSNGDNHKHYDEVFEIRDDNLTSNNQPSPKHFNETLEQRLHDVIRQREQLQRLEAELRGQFIARSEILRMQNSFDEQNKKHATIVSNLQEQLQERDRALHELQQQLEEKERQLHANQREASEAVNQVWAKDGLLREQTSELATLRRERENLLVEQKGALAEFEGERAQLLAQLQVLEDQLQEKGRQLQETEEQQRTVQETVLFKDEQLREAQTWIQRAQELDAFHANANNSLHAELRDRTEQLNQIWLGQQRQLADVERYHMQMIQRLKAEVAEVKEQNRLLRNGSSDDVEGNNEMPGDGSNNKDLQEPNLTDPVPEGVNIASTQGHDTCLPIAGSQAVEHIGPASVFPVNTLTMLHHFGGQPQGVAASVPTVPSQISQSTISQFTNPVIIQAQSQLPTVQAIQHPKLVQQTQSSQIRITHPQQLQVYSHFPENKSRISLEMRINDQQQHGGGQSAVIGGNQTMDFSHLVTVPVTQAAVRHQVLQQDLTQSGDKRTGKTPQGQNIDEKTRDYMNETQAEKREESSQWDGEKHGKSSDENPVSTIDSSCIITPEEKESANGPHVSASHSDINFSDQIKLRPSNQTAFTNGSLVHVATAEANGKSTNPTLLDERSLLACLVRAIPSEASARIKINTTLPNRLGKMLAPAHWHDYKKKYGRLDEFISLHPKLFVVDGDFVHLREGAHAIISATTAVAKVAAAALAPPSIGTNWPPTVAVTPVAHAQSQRARRVGNPVHANPEYAATGGRWEGYLPQLHMHQGIMGHGILGESLASKHQQSGTIFVNGGSKSDAHFSLSNATNSLDASCGSCIVSESTVIDNPDSFASRKVNRSNAVESELYQNIGLSQSRGSRLS